MNRFLYWLSGLLPARLINDGSRPYLERYYMATLFGWRIYLHRFVDDDPDRGLHDHPWSRAFSLVLSGYYAEHRRDGVRIVRWFNSLTADTFHRVMIPDGVPCCWTLFVHKAGVVKTWGFMKPLEFPSESFIFTPYNYDREGGKPTGWWRTAPKGRNVGRVLNVPKV